MVNLDQLLEDRGEDSAKMIATALKILSDQGFFEYVVEQNMQPFVKAFQSTDAATLANQILEVQQTNRVLLTLQELGISMKERYGNHA